MADPTVTKQIVSESPEIEAYKTGLLEAGKNLTDATAKNYAAGNPLLPNYQVAGLSKDQKDAMAMGKQGIGAYTPMVTAGGESLGAGASFLGQAANTLQGADTRNQFGGAQSLYNQAGQAAGQIGNLANVANSGFDYINQGSQGLAQAQQLGANATQAANPQFAQAQQQAQQATQGAGQGFAQGQNTLQQGIGALTGAAQGYDPNSAQAFMNPYQQQVIDASMKQIDRQNAIAQQGVQAQAAQAGAFGGSRDAIQRAEMQRNAADQKNSVIANLMNQGYTQAQAQAQSAFEQQQGRQLQAGSAIGQAGATQGSLAAQQAGVGQAGASLQGSLAGQQAGVGQSGANLLGQLSSSQANLGAQTGQLAGTQAGILGQQAQSQGALAQGIGNLAAQQFGVGQQIAGGIASIGTQAGNLGMQQAQLGSIGQQMQSNDVNALSAIGAQQQKQNQAEIDAARATNVQNAMQPYQQLGYLSDIYKGAPTTQMAVTQQSAPVPSAFQQIAGLGIGALGSVAAASKAGLF